MRKIFFPVGRPAGVADAPIPVPGPGELLARTEAVGVGVGLVRMLRAGDAVRPGGEMVGSVVAAGPDVAGFEIGDRVGGVVFEDVYAEIVLADPRLVSHVPAEVDAAAALALVRGGLIALSTLRAGHVAPGDPYWSLRRPAVPGTWPYNWPSRSERPGWWPPSGRRTRPASSASAEPTRW